MKIITIGYYDIAVEDKDVKEVVNALLKARAVDYHNDRGYSLKGNESISIKEMKETSNE